MKKIHENSCMLCHRENTGHFLLLSFVYGCFSDGELYMKGLSWWEENRSTHNSLVKNIFTFHFHTM